MFCTVFQQDRKNNFKIGPINLNEYPVGDLIFNLTFSKGDLVFQNQNCLKNWKHATVLPSVIYMPDFNLRFCTVYISLYVEFMYGFKLSV